MTPSTIASSNIVQILEGLPRMSSETPGLEALGPPKPGTRAPPSSPVLRYTAGAKPVTRLAQMVEELEMLTANDEQMRLDKDRLQAELEVLGDMEGIPHAELQAEKSNSEREEGARQGQDNCPKLHISGKRDAT
ncbi:hypothetical protein PSPO01_13938 [Paraphaeosphaeria sporulosa]